jgi:hypothetical protein
MTLLLLALACKDPAQGTFVGNPTLRARYLDNEVQVGIGGELVTLETALEPCDGATVSLGPQTFPFDGTEAVLDLELPGEALCGILVVVKDLTIEAEDDGVRKGVTGQDFDLSVPTSAIPADATTLQLTLGDDAWLSGFLPLAPAGDTLLNSQADPALVEAFFDGLDQGSSFEAIHVGEGDGR